MNHSKKVLVVLFVLLLIFSGFLYLKTDKKESTVPEKETGNENIVAPSNLDPKNGTYTIDGEKVTLKNGISSVEVEPGSATTIITQYFGNEVRKDLDGDGREDVAFLITQSGGGTGTFYFLVAALDRVSGQVGTEGAFIGDRIAPQSTNIGKNRGGGEIVVVNYADRGPGESFADEPTFGKSTLFLLDPKTLQFGEVVENFEGEADPSKMSLNMKTWNWIRTELNDGSVITPKISGKFSLTFKTGNRFSATTDCNGIGGEYKVNKNSIVFEKMMSTLMYCEGSQESVFNGFLQNTSSYFFTSKGELVLELKYDSGSVIFR